MPMRIAAIMAINKITPIIPISHSIMLSAVESSIR
ncbi:TPA: hypothetical protein LVL19_004804 [Klebsiella michiganensis]|nr:hypothetical protein [Klebsiella michiganensis]